MLNKPTTNDSHNHQQHVVVGDILLHTEEKIIPIQVFSQLLSATSSLTPDKQIIQRLLPNSSKTNTSQTTVSCDLKNTTSIKPTSEPIKNSSSSKKILRIHKAGLALVKEFKSKVIISNQTEQKSITADTERTYL